MPKQKTKIKKLPMACDVEELAELLVEIEEAEDELGALKDTARKLLARIAP